MNSSVELPSIPIFRQIM